MAGYQPIVCYIKPEVRTSKWDHKSCHCTWLLVLQRSLGQCTPPYIQCIPENHPRHYQLQLEEGLTDVNNFW